MKHIKNNGGSKDRKIFKSKKELKKQINNLEIQKRVTENANEYKNPSIYDFLIKNKINVNKNANKATLTQKLKDAVF